jgi:hypothetical protein
MLAHAGLYTAPTTPALPRIPNVSPPDRRSAPSTSHVRIHVCEACRQSGSEPHLRGHPPGVLPSCGGVSIEDRVPAGSAVYGEDP